MLSTHSICHHYKIHSNLRKPNTHWNLIKMIITLWLKHGFQKCSASRLSWEKHYLQNGLTFYLLAFYEPLKENMIHFPDQQLAQEVIFIWLLHFAAKDKMNLTLFLIFFFLVLILFVLLFSVNGKFLIWFLVSCLFLWIRISVETLSAYGKENQSS